MLPVGQPRARLRAQVQAEALAGARHRLQRLLHQRLSGLALHAACRQQEPGVLKLHTLSIAALLLGMAPITLQCGLGKVLLPLAEVR